MKTAEQIAQERYPLTEEVYPYVFDKNIDALRVSARRVFIEGYNARHQWQKVEPGWRPEGNERWYITDGQSACEAVYIHQVENWVDYTKARPVRVEFTPTHVMPFFFPELPNNQL